MPPDRKESTEGGAVGSASRHGGTSRRRVLADRIAERSVTIGGMAIIASVLGIFIFILAEVLPLFWDAGIEPGREFFVKSSTAVAATVDEYQKIVCILRKDGVVEVHPTDGSTAVRELKHEKLSGRTIRRADALGDCFFVVFEQGPPGAIPLDIRSRFRGGARTVTVSMAEPVFFESGGVSGPPEVFSGRLHGGAALGAVAQFSKDKIVYVDRAVVKNEFSGETSEEFSTTEIPSPGPVSFALVDSAKTNIYAVTGPNAVTRWRIIPEGNTVGQPETVEIPGDPICAFAFHLGDQSLLVGHADGAIDVWFLVGPNNDSKKLIKARQFERRSAAITQFEPSTRDKSFLALDAAGGMGLYHSTANRVLWNGRAPLDDPISVSFAPKADGACLVSKKGAGLMLIHNPHPEVSAQSLFGKVWYEGGSGPEFSWQSSHASNDVEPKFSMVPIVFGTLKGTFYSLLLAIPIAVLAAMYTSQFLPWTLRKIVKPVVEIMAALPSVVVGFIAGLWLAPRMAGSFTTVVMMLFLFPISVVIAGFARHALPRALRNRISAGIEVIISMVAIVIAGFIAIYLGGPVESAVFGGDFRQWLISTTGAPYDQNNAIVVGLAMGFAVIPIIFAVAEDAFSNVPKSLISASLALGANRWQTVTRVVLPTASPGIFSGIMVGFGRAVGETMIVVMATGGTPLIDWSPFNGFKTLSANIANEIPEAAQGSTHYRILFLSGLLLFAFTFAVNTVAELVRQRLRNKYSSL